MLDTVNIASIKELRKELGEHVLLVMALKQMNGELMIDARKWYKHGEVTDFYPSKKGIMMAVKDWKVLFDGVNELISDSEVKDAA